jgi:hypothetical protein
MKTNLSWLRKFNSNKLIKNINFIHFHCFSFLSGQSTQSKASNLNPTGTTNFNIRRDIRLEKIFKNFDLGVIKRDDYLNYLKFLTQLQVSNFSVESLRENQKEYMKYLEQSINKGTISYSSINEILPLVLASSSHLQINSFSFWKIINDLFNSSYHKLGINLIFNILENLNSYYPNNPNVLLLMNTYFNNLTRDKVLAFNLETLINYISVFDSHHHDQRLMDDIQNLLINLSKELNETEKVNYIKKLVPFLVKESKLNMNIILESLADLVVKKFDEMSYRENIEILKIFKNQLNKDIIIDYCKKLDTKINNTQSEISLEESIELLGQLSHLNLGSHETFLKLEKLIGLNIDQVPTDKIVNVFENFLKSNKFREKFPLLIQDIVVKRKFQFNFEDICKILKLYSDIGTTNLYVYEKLHDYCLTIIPFLNSSQLANIIYAYSYNKEISKDLVYSILEKSEGIFRKIMNEKNLTSNELIKVLYGFSTTFERNDFLNIIQELSNVVLHDLDKLKFTNKNAFDIVLLFKTLQNLKISPTIELENLLKRSIDLLTRHETLVISQSIRISGHYDTSIFRLIEQKLN